MQVSQQGGREAASLCSSSPQGPWPPCHPLVLLPDPAGHTWHPGTACLHLFTPAPALCHLTLCSLTPHLRDPTHDMKALFISSWEKGKLRFTFTRNLIFFMPFPASGDASAAGSECNKPGPSRRNHTFLNLKDAFPG